MPNSCSFGLGVLTALLALSLGSAASALTTESVSWSGQAIIGGENPGYLPSGTATFTWEEACVGSGPSFCGLRITLQATPTSSGPAPSQGESLAGLLGGR